jgi:hypothetical protein
MKSNAVKTATGADTQTDPLGALDQAMKESRNLRRRVSKALQTSSWDSSDTTGEPEKAPPSPESSK